MLPTLLLNFSSIIPLPTSLLSHPPFPTAPYVSSSLLPTPLLSALFHTLLLHTFLPPFFSLLPTSLLPTLPYSPTPSSLSSLFFRFPNPHSLPHHSPTPSSPTLLPPYSSEPLVSALPYSSIRSHLTYYWLYCATATRLLLLPNLMFGISNLKRKLP